MRKRKRIFIVICSVVLFLCFLYFLLVYYLVSTALVPAFMKKLEAFERITDECYAAQVQTSDIKVNRQLNLNETNVWLEDAECRKLSAKTDDGYILVAAEFSTDEDSHKWALVLHGYTGWKEEMYPFAYWYHQEGYHVVVPDLRCQGESEGDFIGMGWTDHYDCNIWIDYILQQDPEAQIVLHGQSMGAATALMMTGEDIASDHIVAVISDSAYTDAYSMFGDKIKEWFNLPAFPLVDSACVVLKLRGGYNLKDASALNAVQKSDTPTLFIHGDEDAMISVQMTKDLYEAASCPKEILIIEGAGHAQAQDKDPEKYYETIKSFLDLHVPQSVILKYSNKLSCCNLTLGGKKPLIPERHMDNTRSRAYCCFLNRREYFRKACADGGQLMKDIARYTEAVRAGRSDTRDIQAQSFKGFIYRVSA